MEEKENEGGSVETNGKGDIENHLLRGPIPYEEDEQDVDKVEKKDFRKPEFRDTKPNLDDHRDGILKSLRNGETIRVIHTRLGITRKMVMHYIDNDEELREAFEDAKEDLLDLNEEIVNEIATTDCSMVETDNGMFPRIDGRTLATKFNAAKFRLERLGAKRGWNAKLETNEVGNGAGRVPCIFVGDVSEAQIADCEALIEDANQKAMEGLEGIPRG